jgi:hypothetical protein
MVGRVDRHSREMRPPTKPRRGAPIGCSALAWEPEVFGKVMVGPRARNYLSPSSTFHVNSTLPFLLPLASYST